ncbi:hypothetical protein [Listeria booriae]|uniref:hypothetical protein n=1 Tax=Listeria booriae TaxID=1552123 RepID=UPI00162AAA76|nr:hypothetical protein [Listeria booriae]MBC1290500.1 hypothetical protein [Listeria booriae]
MTMYNVDKFSILDHAEKTSLFIEAENEIHLVLLYFKKYREEFDENAYFEIDADWISWGVYGGIDRETTADKLYAVDVFNDLATEFDYDVFERIEDEEK